jgi:peptidoglycan/LPS O-acetylase OafA/YrhL
MSEQADAHGEGRVGLAHIPALDGLRGVAVAVVLWFHAGHLTGGYLGVDLFFTLSGYLITSLLVVEWRRTGDIRLGPFWGRRVRRLLPALVVMLVVVGLVARWQVLPAARGDLRDAGLATLAYVANWQAILGGNGYWDQTLTPSWLEHTWSLAIEEQFYLVWPLVVLAVLSVQRRWPKGIGRNRSRERRVRLLGTVALVGAVLSAGGMIVASLAGASLERLYLGTDTRVAAILLGAAAACFQRADGSVRPVPEPRRTALAGAAVAATAFLVVMWAVLDGTSAVLYRGGLLACGIAAVVIIVDISTPGRSVVGPVLALPPLRFLGAISYGLYLYHWPIYRFLGESDLGLTGWNLTAARVLASLAAAVLSHRFVEQPILQRRWRWPSVRLAPVGIAAAVLALLVGSIGAVDIAPASQDQEGTRPDLGPREAADRVVVTTTAPPAGETASSTTAPVARVEELIDPVVLIVGDSVAFSLAEDGFVAQEERLGLTTVNGAQIGCTLMRDEGFEPPPEASFINDCSGEWPDLVAEYQPDVVMVLFGAYGGIEAVPIDGTDRFPCTDEYDSRWRSRLEDAVTTLSAGGAVVQLVTAPTGPLGWDDQGSFDERQECINTVIEEVGEERTEAQTVDLAGWVCPDGECQESIDGVFLRNDGLHFRGGGAVLVSRWLAPHLKRVEVEVGAEPTG